MLIYQRESLSDILFEVQGLMHEHWREVTGDGPPLDPDWDLYRSLDERGLIHTLTVRDPDDSDQLVGYVVMILACSLHYRTFLTAHDDAFFLKKEYRKGRAGFKMFQIIEQQLKASGVRRILYHTKIKVPQARRVLERLGYEAREVHMFKEI